MSLIDKPLGDGTEPTLDVTLSLQEDGNVETENRELFPLVAHIKERFARSRYRKVQDETRWIEAYRNYRGIYDESVSFTSTEQSQLFIKVTKTKVLAAVAQIGDVLFAGNKFPIGIEATPVPEGEGLETFHIEFEDKAKAPGGATTSRPELASFMSKMLEGRVDEKLKTGPGKTPTSATYEPAKIAAKKMERKIHDQLEESDAAKHLRFKAFEMALFGTGIVKGPFAINKEYPNWEKDSEIDGRGIYKPTFKTVPKINAVSVWNFYPDADAHNMEECEYAIERHKMSAHQLRGLKKRPFFRKDSIDIAISHGYNYHPEYWESIIEDGSSHMVIERFEVLEFWGMIDREAAEASGLEIPSEFEDQDEFQINAWICNDQILRCVLNPYTPQHIPYYATPYEVNPYSFFGVGVAENMADTQLLMNGVMRMTVDNLALSGNIILEINENNLVPGQDFELYPGKIFKTEGQLGQSMHSVDIKNVTQELMQVYDKARQLTDESTNMPSYAHGGTGVAGMGRTASGMSMLMGAAAQSIKAIVRNIDDYFLAPLGKRLFEFNMQFDYDDEIKGDLAVIARGTDSLMRNEIRSQRLLQFLQTGTQNPATAPMVKVDYILRELAASLDLDEDLIVNDPREMMIQADIIKQMSEAMGVNTNPAGGQAPQGGAQDPTGNGGATIAPGNAPEPGAAGFTGAGGGNNGGQQPPQQGA